MVVSGWDEKVEGVLAGVPTRPVTAVMAESDGLNQGHIDAHAAGDRGRYLSHLEGVGQPSALMIGRKDDDLGLARKPPKCRGVHNPIPVALEAGALIVRLFCDGAIPSSVGKSRARSQRGTLLLLPQLPIHNGPRPRSGPRA
jgi:hypothetical protein